MKMTKKKEGELIAHLRKEHVSIPELQFEMKVSYKDARSLIEYATGHKWIKGCTSGNEYPVIVTNFSRKDLPADICKKIYDSLGYDDLKVLYYLGKRFSATLLDILEDVDDDEDDMQDALDKLIGIKLIFKHEEYYFCKISRKSIKLIKKNEKNEEQNSTLDFHHLLEELE